jgi:hypothetical protein
MPKDKISPKFKLKLKILKLIQKVFVDFMASQTFTINQILKYRFVQLSGILPLLFM